MRSACSARLLVKGTSKSTRKRRTSSLNLCSRRNRFSPGLRLGLPVAARGRLAVEREPFAQSLPEADVEALEKGAVERSFAPRFGVPDRPVGVEQEIAHGSRPRLMIEFDQRFELAQVVGVAER